MEQASKEEVVKADEGTAQPEQELVAENGHARQICPPSRSQRRSRTRLKPNDRIAWQKQTTGNIEFQIKYQETQKEEAQKLMECGGPRRIRTADLSIISRTLQPC